MLMAIRVGRWPPSSYLVLLAMTLAAEGAEVLLYNKSSQNKNALRPSVFLGLQVIKAVAWTFEQSSRLWAYSKYSRLLSMARTIYNLLFLIGPLLAFYATLLYALNTFIRERRRDRSHHIPVTRHSHEPPGASNRSGDTLVDALSLEVNQATCPRNGTPLIGRLLMWLNNRESRNGIHSVPYQLYSATTYCLRYITVASIGIFLASASIKLLEKIAY